MPPRSEDGDGGPLTPRAAAALLALLTALALGARLLGLGFQLPHAWEPDALVLVRQAEYLEAGITDAESDVFSGYYPQLIARLCLVLPRPAPAAEASTLQEHLDAAGAARLRVRRTIALLSVLLVPATYLLARFFLARPEALCAAGLAAFSLLHMWFSQQTRPHAVSAPLAVLGVVGALALQRRGDLAGYAAAGLGAALAVGSLQSGAAVLGATLAAHLLRRRGGTRHPHLLFLGVLAACALAVRVYYPFLFAPSRGADAAALGLEARGLNLSGHVVRLDAFDGRGFAVVFDSLRTYEPLLAALSIAGSVLALWSARGAGGARAWIAGREGLLVVLAYAVPYLVAIGLYAHTYQRFVLPLVPFLACLAAYGLFRAARLWVDARGPVAGGFAPGRAAAVLLVSAQCVAVFQLGWIRSRADTSEEATAWIAREVPPGEALLLTPSLDLPLARTRAALERVPPSLGDTWPWLAYQKGLRAPIESTTPRDLVPLPVFEGAARDELRDDPAAWFRRSDVRWAVLDASRGPLRPGFAEALRGARATGRLVARFSPQGGGDAWPLGFQDDYFDERPVWWWRTLSSRRTGRVIEIYRIGPDPR